MTVKRSLQDYMAGGLVSIDDSFECDYQFLDRLEEASLAFHCPRADRMKEMMELSSMAAPSPEDELILQEEMAQREKKAREEWRNTLIELAERCGSDDDGLVLGRNFKGSARFYRAREERPARNRGVRSMRARYCGA